MTTNSPIPVAAKGFLLLTIPDVDVAQVFEGRSNRLATGELQIEVVSLPKTGASSLLPSASVPSSSPSGPNPFSDAPPSNKDLYLVLKVSDFELCLLPHLTVTRSPPFLNPSSAPLKSIVFRIPNPTNTSAVLDLAIPTPTNEEDQQDLETLEILLHQYGCLPAPEGYFSRVIPGAGLLEQESAPSSHASTPVISPAPTPAPASSSALAPPPATRPGMPHRNSSTGGRFVLVDETTGQILGELEQPNADQLTKEQEQSLAANEEAISEKGKQEAVVVDFGEIEGGIHKAIQVRTVNENEMDDWMLKGAHYLSKGILTIGTTYSSGITSAAEFYTKHSTPRAEPYKFSPEAKEGIRQVHNISAKGLKVTRKTLGAVQDAIGGVITHVAEPVFRDIDEFKQSRTPPQSAPPSRRSSAAPGTVPPYFARPNGAALSGSAVATGPPSHAQGGPSPTAGVQNLSLSDKKSPPPIPPRVQTGQSDFPSAAQEKAGLLNPGSPTSPNAQASSSRPQRGFWNRVFTAAEVIGTSLEATTSSLVTSTTNAASAAAGHKYGPEAGHAAKLLGGTVHHAALVYVDVRGVGRKTIIASGKKGVKGVIKTRLASGEEVTIQTNEKDGSMTVVNGEAAQDLTIKVEQPAPPPYQVGSVPPSAPNSK